LIWPTKRDRSQGLLIPRARFGDKFGARLQSGYFIPFGESMDATIYGDISSERYFGAGVDIRYVPSENIKIGDFRAYAVNNVPQKQIEWKYQYRHAQENLPGGFRGVVDVKDYSDLNFFREYDDDPQVLTQSNIYSSAYLTKNRAKYSLNILSDRRDLELLVNDTNDEDGDGNTSELTAARQRYEQLPSLQLRMYPQQVGRTPFYFALESSASRLRTGSVIGGERTIDADYYRTDLFPTLSMRMRTPAWLAIKPTVSVRQTWYSASRDPGTGKIDDTESLSRFYAQGQVDIVGPSFSRVFNKSMGGFSRFKHVIEPRLSYVRTTDVNDQNRVPYFDLVDSPSLPIVQDSIEYSLTQRIIGKEASPAGSAREILSFSLRQNMALADPFPRAGVGAGEHKFTPLLATLRYNPYQSTSVDASARFGNVTHQLDQLSVSANLLGTGKNSDKYLSFTYSALLEQPNLPNSDSSQLLLNTGSFLIKDRLRADVRLTYDVKQGEFLDHRYLTGWTGSCYGVALEYRRYRVFGSSAQDEFLSSYGVAITLKNVGTIGSN
jgi:lipopolysaccharide assembly outer membrane protein LptD (OstA)